MSLPITSQSFPPEFSAEFRVVTVDMDGHLIDTVYHGANEEMASAEFLNTVKRLKRAREEEGGSYEPAIVRFYGSGETQEMKVA